jgi:hypothetical protein
LPVGVTQITILALGTLLGAQQPPPVEEAWEKISSQSFETIEAGSLVRVVNPFGAIHARFGGYENRVEILATVQRPKGGPSGPAVSISPTKGGGLEVTTAPGSEPDPPDGPRSRVDLVLFVPERAALDAETREDQINVKGLKGDVTARSEQGDIRIRSVEGRVRAKTTRGQIAASLEADVTSESQDLSTETGDIEVWLWEDADMEVEIATSGEISTDFTISIEHRRFEEPGKRAMATVGVGGPKLSLYTKRGRVRLLRLQRPMASEN